MNKSDKEYKYGVSLSRCVYVSVIPDKYWNPRARPRAEPPQIAKLHDKMSNTICDKDLHKTIQPYPWEKPIPNNFLYQ